MSQQSPGRYGTQPRQSQPSQPTISDPGPPPPPSYAAIGAIGAIMSILAAIGGAFVTYGVQSAENARTKADVAAVRDDLRSHIAETTQRRFDNQRVITEHQTKIATLEADRVETSRLNADIRTLIVKIDALCRATRAANCGP